MVKDRLLELNNDGNFEGKNPLTLSIKDLCEAGHADKPIGKIIRDKCVECCCGQMSEVRKCVSFDCPLWPYRMGKNPFLSAKTKSRKSNLKG